MNRPTPLRLTLFLTHARSLRTWHELGTFDREMAIYRKLQDTKGIRLSIVSYGGRDEYDFATALPNVRILCNWIGWSELRYSYRLHQLHGFRLWQSDIYKTNQMNGAKSALRASALWKRPLMLRFGYVWSEPVNARTKPDAPHRSYVKEYQRICLAAADHVVMTAPAMLERLQTDMPSLANKTSIISNYVDTDVFFPADRVKQFDIIFIGRCTQQKNLDNLLAAIQKTKFSLAMVGDGELRQSLQDKYGDLDGRLHWFGIVHNSELPSLINQARVLILPSHWEGHPKALIEAMACGIPIVGTNVRGIADVLTHKVTGYLCNTDPEDIAKSLETLLSQPALMQSLGDNALRFATEHYSLNSIAEQEYELLSAVADQYRNQRRDVV